MPTHFCRLRMAIPALLLALGLTLVGGCGFQPRGLTTGAAGLPSPIRIGGLATFDDLYRELDRQLGIAGVEVVAVAAEGSSLLAIANLKSDSRLLSVNSRNRAVEYELIEQASFALSSADGHQLLGPQTLTVMRILYRPEIAVLGSDREAELLRRDMREELAGRIIQRLAVQRQSTQ